MADAARQLYANAPQPFETLLCELSSRFISVPVEEIDRAIEDVQRSDLPRSSTSDLSALWQAAPGDARRLHAHPLLQLPGGPAASNPRDERDRVLPLADGRDESQPRRRCSRRWRNCPRQPPSTAKTCDVRCQVERHRAAGGRRSGTPVGALGFNATRAPRDWPDALVKRLQLVAQIFANALARKRADIALRESEARLSLAADSADAGLWVFDYRDAHLLGGGADQEDLRVLDGSGDYARRVRGVGSPGRLAPVVRDAIEDAARSPRGVAVEYRIVQPGRRCVPVGLFPRTASLFARPASRTASWACPSTSPTGNAPTTDPRGASAVRDADRGPFLED